VTFEKGKPYYFEVLFKEQQGGDFFRVSVEYPFPEDSPKHGKQYYVTTHQFLMPDPLPNGASSMVLGVDEGTGGM